MYQKITDEKLGEDCVEGAVEWTPTLKSDSNSKDN